VSAVPPEPLIIVDPKEADAPAGSPEMLKSMFPVNPYPDAELVKTWLVSCCGFSLLLWYLSLADLAT